MVDRTQCRLTLAVVSGSGLRSSRCAGSATSASHDSAVQLVTAFQTSDFQEAIHIVVMLPEGLSKPEIVARLGPDARFVHLFLTRLEGIGMLVGRREIAIDHVADLISGPVVVGWRKLCRYVEDERRDRKRRVVGVGAMACRAHRGAADRETQNNRRICSTATGSPDTATCPIP